MNPRAGLRHHLVEMADRVGDGDGVEMDEPASGIATQRRPHPLQGEDCEGLE